LIKSLF